MSDPTSVPVISAPGLLSPQLSQQLPDQDVCKQIAQACESWGFFQLVDHGFDEGLIDEFTAAMHSFFDLPLDVKFKVWVAGKSKRSGFFRSPGT
jgi:isopenicillin N synthase-like dioxygenase